MNENANWKKTGQKNEEASETENARDKFTKSHIDKLILNSNEVI